MIICVLWILCFWSAAKMHNPLSCNPRVLVIFSLNVDFHLQDFLIYICAKKSPLSMQMKTFSNHLVRSFLPLLCSIYHFSVNSSFLLCLPLFLLHYYLILQVFNSLVPYLLDHSSKMIKHFYPQINWPRFSFFILSLPIFDCAFLYIHPSIHPSIFLFLSLSLSLSVYHNLSSSLSHTNFPSRTFFTSSNFQTHFSSHSTRHNPFSEFKISPIWYLIGQLQQRSINVLGGERPSRVCKFKSWHPILDGFICWIIVLFQTTGNIWRRGLRWQRTMY